MTRTFRSDRTVARILVVLALGILILWGAWPGIGGAYKDDTMLEGTIYVVGNEPFVEIALRAVDGRTYTLRGEALADLRRLQGRTLLLRGKKITGEKFLYTEEGFWVGEYQIKDNGKE